MRLIGCDLHAAQQTLATLDRDTGHVREAVLRHDSDQVRMFYPGLSPPVLRRTRSDRLDVVVSAPHRLVPQTREAATACA
jgi:hypothetical protein